MISISIIQSLIIISVFNQLMNWKCGLIGFHNYIWDFGRCHNLVGIHNSVGVFWKSTIYPYQIQYHHLQSELSGILVSNRVCYQYNRNFYQYQIVWKQVSFRYFHKFNDWAEFMTTTEIWTAFFQDTRLNHGIESLVSNKT